MGDIISGSNYLSSALFNGVYFLIEGGIKLDLNFCLTHRICTSVDGKPQSTRQVTLEAA